MVAPPATIEAGDYSDTGISTALSEYAYAECAADSRSRGASKSLRIRHPGTVCSV